MIEVSELLKATQGKLICGDASGRVKGISIDSRSINPYEAFCAIKGNNFDGHDFINNVIKNGCKCVIAESFPKPLNKDKSSLTLIKVENTTKALGDIARFRREKFNIPVIAVTGSNGKTTTKEMVACVLSKKYKVLKNEGTKNNHIGLPLTLINLDETHSAAVLEIGTNHPGEVKYLVDIAKPNIGIVTNIGLSHLEYFCDLEGVYKEKSVLINNLKTPGIGILNADDVLLKKRAFGKKTGSVVFGFGLVNESDYFATCVKSSGVKQRFLVQGKYWFTINTLGRYNIYNALAAISCGRILGLSYRQIVLALAKFKFPYSRLNFLEINSVRFIDDTYNSNPVSLKQALNALSDFEARGRKIFVMGDMLELGSRTEEFHRQAGINAAGICNAFIAVGKYSRLAASAAIQEGFSIKNVFTCDNSVQAKEILFSRLSPRSEDIVLVKGSRSMRMEEVFNK
ncbi:MAG: UDP-N-acetylmuramoyl-tripeptide--D-alanyl-D-alanine ligase [Candidatus Omnitrophica bacterium]|nr:UDP-N-acetylmuramoyl-tripeptide--D-alanyl-D-alanine ligase [Candidatus Omnitrophota bacterium]